jgi:hypothetical protein
MSASWRGSHSLKPKFCASVRMCARLISIVVSKVQFVAQFIITVVVQWLTMLTGNLP